MSGITTHVLDVSLGRPAAGVPVILESLADGKWAPNGAATTDADGRAPEIGSSDAALQCGMYRLRFAVAGYFRAHGVAGFYPEITITFEVRDPTERYHVPLLLSPWGYTTYRGS
jgi:5-hydroxyisourate hydrolase